MICFRTLRAGLILGGALAQTFSGRGQGAGSTPRPATEIRYLSGRGTDDAVDWDFFCTDGRQSGIWTKIKVPSCWELQGFGTYQYGLTVRKAPERRPPIASEQGKYRTTFEVPAEWKGRVVRLVFAGAMTDTEASINGHSAGPKHQGAFYQFKYDVSALLKYGDSNQLDVTVSKESSDSSVNEAERRADYWNFGGIFRPVFLEISPAQFIDRVAIDAKADGSFLAEAFLGVKAGAGMQVTTQLLDGAGAPVSDPWTTPVVAGESQIAVRGALAKPRLWTAETPHLYEVQFTLSENGTIRHGRTERFGFRTFEVRPKDGLYLNGAKIVLKGVNRHSFRPESGRTLSEKLNYEDVRLIQEMNMNAVRMSHYPPDVDFLRACDELGLYVLDELGGWHGHYDTATGKKLIAEMVPRDVNHPSILFWDNGNEGGWNKENDGEFAKWDPQHRPVLHPQQFLSGVETMHYRSYPETQRYLAAPEIFMPTEFLHGLYDGGHGAGLFDYWELMRQSPRSAGGFLWSLADEGVVRTDENGRIDNQGDLAPDGIVGPHHEKEGSFFTVKQIWSPVQVGPAILPPNFDGRLKVENRYNFNSLDRCTFLWELARFAGAAAKDSGHQMTARGALSGPRVAPGAAGELALPLPADWREADVLYVTAQDPAGRVLWTWSWSWKMSDDLFRVPPGAAAGEPARLRDTEDQLTVTAGELDYRFSKATGEISGVRRNGKNLEFRNGPRFIAARRGDRTPEGAVDTKAPKGADRVYVYLPTASRLQNIAARTEGKETLVAVDYSGPLQSVRWHIMPDGDVRMDYEYEFNGVVELMGVWIDFPESTMRSIRWLGEGPSRVWQNRLMGTKLDVWQNAYSETTPGETFTYPEFKGYFRGWRWATFTTTEGSFSIGNESGSPFLGVYTPRDGTVGKLFELPETGIAFLNVIPAIRNKVNATDLIGPQSQAQTVSGKHRGAIQLRFDPK